MQISFPRYFEIEKTKKPKKKKKGIAEPEKTYEVFERKIQRIEKQQSDLLYAISDGSKTDMDAWNGTEVFDFFTYLWSRDDAIKKEISRIKNTEKPAAK